MFSIVSTTYLKLFKQKITSTMTGSHSNCIFKFPVFSLFFPCPTANFPYDSLRDF